MASVGKDVHPSMSGRNYSTTAAWRLTRLDHEGYVGLESGSLSPYLAIPGWRFETVVFDYMHNIFLGCGRDLFASGLKLLISKGVWTQHGEDCDSILAAVHMEMHKSCAAMGFLIGALVIFPCTHPSSFLIASAHLCPRSHGHSGSISRASRC